MMDQAGTESWQRSKVDGFEMCFERGSSRHADRLQMREEEEFRVTSSFLL